MKSFCLPRLFRLVRLDLVQGGTRLLLGLLIGVWSLYVALLLLRCHFGSVATGVSFFPAFVRSNLGTLHFLALLVFVPYGSMQLNLRQMDRQGRAFHLSLPVTPLERVVARWLVVGVIFPVVATAVAWLAHGVACGLARLLLGASLAWAPGKVLGLLAPISLSWVLFAPVVLLLQYYSLRDVGAPRRVRGWLTAGLLLALFFSFSYVTERAGQQIAARTGVTLSWSHVLPAVPALLPPVESAAAPPLSEPAAAAVARLRPWLHLEWYVFWFVLVPAFCLVTARASLRELED